MAVGVDNETFEIDMDHSMEQNSDNNNGSCAVVVRGACKKYGKNPILKYLNMTVQEGTVYALLGASGCGKSTLLSTMVGVKKLDSGSITIFGGSPGSVESGVPGKNVGYMPQELSLFGQFTIREALQYFGRIYGLSELTITEKMEFLLSLLKLPPSERKIQSLSGGQQRRVSFAVTLLHEPRLLILDEPTVGVDPLLSQSIWNHLTNLVSTGKSTVIITTHYIEEAKKTNRVGIMRGGRLITEECPQNLLDSHNTSHLEDVVLSLCHADEIKDDDMETSHEIQDLPPPTNPKHDIPKTGKSRLKLMWNAEKESLNRLRALVIKNLIFLWRQILFVFTLFFLPGLQLTIFCLAIGREPSGLNFGIVNHESNCENLLDIKNKTILSCRLINTLPKDTMNLIHFETEDEATEKIHAGKLWGYISFPQNFSLHTNNRAIFGIHTESEDLDGSSISVKLDMSNMQVANSLRKALYESTTTYSIQLIEEYGRDSKLALGPLVFDEPVYGSLNSTNTEFMAPGIFLSLLFFMAVTLTGVAFITEKKEGMLERSLVAGVTTTEVILSHAISQYIIMAIQTLVTLVILIYGFQIPVHGSIVGVIILALLQGTVGMLFGFLLSTVCSEEKVVMQLTTASLMPLFVFSGIIWPVESMPAFMQTISYFLPQTLACDSMRSLLIRGWGFLHLSVWPGFAVSSAWILAFWILTVLFAKFQVSIKR